MGFCHAQPCATRQVFFGYNEPRCQNRQICTLNLSTIHRRKTIVCVNDATRFAFILHGIKASDVKKPDQLLLDGIRQSLISEGIAPEIVERYLSTASGDDKIVHTKTASRKAAAVLNSVCMNVDSISEQDVYSSQSHVMVLNRFAFLVNKNQMACPCNLLIKELGDRYGEPVFQTDAAELTVTLNPDDRNAIRRLIVPAFYTFEELHNVIQTAFPWEDYHLHRFTLAQDEYSIPTGTIAPADVECDKGEAHHAESEVHLSDVFQMNTRFGDGTIVYHYDFGDDWKHDVKLERIVPQNNINYARCMHMEGDAPQEDVGGPAGFQYILDVLKNKKQAEQANTKSWISGMGWKPIAMGEIDKVNQRLMKRQYGHCWYFGRRELLGNLYEAQVWIKRRMEYFNTVRPHNSLGSRLPAPQAIACGA